MQNLSVKQAATKLRKSEATVRRWAASGKLQAQKRGNRWEILSLDMNSLSPASQPEALADLTQDAVDKIVDGVSRRVAECVATAGSSCELESQVRSLSFQNDGFFSALQSVYDSIKKIKNEQKQLLNKISLQEQLLYQQTLQIARLEASRPYFDLSVRDSEEHLPSESSRGVVPDLPSCSVAKSSDAVANKPAKAKIDNEEKAEKWVRANTDKWLDDSCRAGRSWRELATNTGDLVSIRGRSQKPRSYLHIIAKTDKSAWNRMKAKVALELFPSDSNKQFSQNHYEHEFEVGGG